jgi:putative ABC transport system permease protein
MDDLFQDLKYTFRVIVRQPGFTVLIVVILALGIGVNTAIFSLVNAVILRPLPFPDSSRLIQIKQDLPGYGPNPLVYVRELRNWQKENRSFSQIEAYGPEMANLSGSAEAEHVSLARVSGGFFRMLQILPIKGRDFLPEEDSAGGQPVTLLSEGLWKRRFAGDVNVLGKTVTVDDKVYTVVGIIPTSFQIPGPYTMAIDLWMTLASAGSQAKYGGGVLVQVIGRLKPGVPARAAAAELDNISGAMAKGRALPKAVPVSWQEEVIGEMKPRLLVFLGAVGFVLLIACANIANLLLSRAAVREKEIAVRTALGAERMRILRQLLTESMVLATLGALLGLVFAFWAKNLLHTAITAQMGHIPKVSIDPRVLGFTVGLALLTGVLFGLAPALRSSRIELVESLKEGGRGSRGSKHHRLSDLLVIAEVAIALVLLIGAGLLLRSMLLLQRVDPGFRLGNILCMTIDLTPSKYPKPRDQASYFQRVIERVQALPGVQSAALSACVPLGHFGMQMSGVEVEGRPAPEDDRDQRISFNVVSSDYFRTMNISLRAGRYFSEADSEGAPGVAIVSEAFARSYFQNENPIGRQLKTPFQRNEWLTIVGVVGDVHQEGLDRQAQPQLYRSYLQAGTQFMALVVRTSGDPLKIAPAVRSQVMSVDRDQPAFGIATLQEMMEGTLKPRKTNLILLGVFALFALILASVGIYGVVSYNVSGQTHEIGVRMALGARPLNVVGMIVGRAMVHTLIGVVVGLAAAAGVTRFLSSLLYGVKTIDPVTFAAISLLLVFISFVASCLPSFRATRGDPMEALRYE